MPDRPLNVPFSLAGHLLPIEELEVLRVQGMPSGSQDLKLWREEDFQIHCSFSYPASGRDAANKVTGELTHPQWFGRGGSQRRLVLARSRRFGFVVRLLDLRLRSYDWRKDQVLVECAVDLVQIRLSPGPPASSQIMEWYVNGTNQFPFTENSSSIRSVKYKVKFGDDEEFESAEFPTFVLGRSHYQINYEGQRICIGYIGESTAVPQPMTWIKVPSRRLSSELLDAVSSLHSFLTGCELVYVGRAYLDRELFPTRATFLSPRGVDVEQIIGRGPLFPAPIDIRRSHASLDIESLFAKLLERWMELSRAIPLAKATWYLQQSSSGPLDLRIQPLATAFDLIVKAWFRSDRASSSSLIDKVAFERALGKEFGAIKARLKAVPLGDKIVSKMRGANQTGNTSRGIQLLKDLGLDFDEIEKTALNERHSVVHGQLDGRDYEKLHWRTLAFRTIVHRVILKLLGYDGDYIDYSRDAGILHTYMPWPLHMPMQGYKRDKSV